MIDLKLLNKAINTLQEDKKRTTFCINMPIALRDKMIAYSKKNKISASKLIITLFEKIVESEKS
jgi:hypothetical protein